MIIEINDAQVFVGYFFGLITAWVIIPFLEYIWKEFFGDLKRKV